jgi:cephalosporin hydroxylase
MIITIDTERNLFQISDTMGAREYGLFSPEAFQILSRHWMVLGWNLHHSFTFSFMGRQFIQFPDDMLRAGELMWRSHPDVILETGVYDGGSTLFWAMLCRMRSHGRVISVEKNFRPGVREAVLEAAGDVVTLVEGDASSAEVADRVRREIREGERVCIFLDSDHSAKHVAAELNHFSALVAPGCYMVVSDSNMPDVAHTPRARAAVGETYREPHPWLSDSPAHAVDEFLALHPEFCRERPVPLFPEEKFDFTELSYCPGTWLKRCES